MDVKFLNEHIKGQAKHFDEANVLFDIYEGNLLPYIEKQMSQDLSFQVYNEAKSRIAPINLLIKLVDKLSKLYANDPVRTIVDGSAADSELLSWYEGKFKVNKFMNQSNEFFNLFKSFLLEPFIDKGVPQMRVIPDNQFTVLSTDITNPMRPTHVITLHGKETMADGTQSQIFFGYTEDQFVIFNDRDEIKRDMMAAIGNSEGINPYGVLPFTYVNRSLNKLVPCHDSDMMQMSVLIPILLSDLNFGVKFQIFSIMYGIDVDDENLTFGPNAFWRFKSDPNTEKTPSVGAFKPEMDISQALELITTQMALWLDTKGLKPGSVGSMAAESAASGIAKMIDNADTTENRKAQIQFMGPGEVDFWNLTMHHMVPVWSKARLIENTSLFSTNAEVEIKYAEQIPIAGRGQLVADLQLEMNSGFISRKRAVKKLNPLMSDSEIEELLSEIEEESILEVDEPEPEIPAIES